LVAIGPVVSEEKIFMWISHKVLCSAKKLCPAFQTSDEDGRNSRT
jgi:hypothetical protein